MKRATQNCGCAIVLKQCLERCGCRFAKRTGRRWLHVSMHANRQSAAREIVASNGTTLPTSDKIAKSFFLFLMGECYMASCLALESGQCSLAQLW